MRTRRDVAAACKRKQTSRDEKISEPESPANDPRNYGNYGSQASRSALPRTNRKYRAQNPTLHPFRSCDPQHPCLTSQPPLTAVGSTLLPTYALPSTEKRTKHIAQLKFVVSALSRSDKELVSMCKLAIRNVPSWQLEVPTFSAF